MRKIAKPQSFCNAIQTPRRPILCYPGESEEVAAIAKQMNAPLYRCRSEAELQDAFDQTLGPNFSHASTVNQEALAGFSWEEQALRLEAVFEESRAS